MICARLGLDHKWAESGVWVEKQGFSKPAQK